MSMLQRYTGAISGWSIMMLVVAMMFAPTVMADEAEEKKPEPPTVPVTYTETWEFDAEALKAAVEEADADEETGEKSASILGTLTRTSSTGNAESMNAMFSQTKAKDGTWGEVTSEVAMSQTLFTVNNLWIMIAAALVFIMHLGFACLEMGFSRAKNTVNVLFKNTMIPCIGLLTYALCGFTLMYPGDAWIIPGFLGLDGIGIGGGDNTVTYGGGYTYWTDFLFQGMFAATAATIVSGAVVERVKLIPFLIFATIFVAIVYPIAGSWHWGAGFMTGEDYFVYKTFETGFADFAGSTLVHSVGGWGALMGAIILGPRLGKYNADGSSNAIPGHSMPLAGIGVFLLWFGWFGFNGGSQLDADPTGVSLVLVTTALAASAGAIGAFLASIGLLRSFDISMVLNGILAGLVGITAGPDLMDPLEAVLVGLISGAVVVPSVLMFDKLKVDDPVGATSVHLTCGILGTLFCGLLGSSGIIDFFHANEDGSVSLIGTNGATQLIVQFIGVIAYGIFTVICAGVLFAVLKFTVGIRVSKEEEIEGLDLGEHDMASYPDFQPTSIKSYHLREM